MNAEEHRDTDERPSVRQHVARFFVRVGRGLALTALGRLAAVLIVALASTVVGLWFTPVHHDELVLVSSFGHIVEGPLEPGIHWYMPYFNTIRRYPTTRQFLLITDKTVGPDKAFVETLFQEGVAIDTSDNVPVSVILEVSYRIEKKPETVKAFVADFGRASTAYGTAKVEKLIADNCRNAARATLANSSLTDAKARVSEISRGIQGAAMGTRGEGDSLSDIGIDIVTLGYRLQVAREVEASRVAESIKLQIEEMRKKTIEAKAAADALEVDKQLELAEKRIQLATAERSAFEASPESSLQMARSKLFERWDGQVPRLLVVGDGSPLLESLIDAAGIPLVEPGATEQTDG